MVQESGSSQRIIMKTFITKIFLQLDFRDTQGGSKFIRKDALKKIGNDFQCLDFTFDIELLLKLEQKGLKTEEVHVEHYFNEESTVNIIRDTFPVFMNLLKLRKKFYKSQRRLRLNVKK